MRNFLKRPKAFHPNRLFVERNPLREQALAIEAERLGKSKGRRVLRRRFWMTNKESLVQQKKKWAQIAKESLEGVAVTTRHSHKL